MAYLSARKKPTIVRGYDCCERKLLVENNLLVRQAAPMLLTNGGATSRELYSPGFLTTITTMLNQAAASAELPVIGVAMVSMRTRFAGLHRPDAANVSIPQQLSFD